MFARRAPARGRIAGMAVEWASGLPPAPPGAPWTVLADAGSPPRDIPQAFVPCCARSGQLPASSAGARPSGMPAPEASLGVRAAPTATDAFVGVYRAARGGRSGQIGLGYIPDTPSGAPDAARAVADAPAHLAPPEHVGAGPSRHARAPPLRAPRPAGRGGGSASARGLAAASIMHG